MLQWIAGHVAGWQVLLPTILAYAIGAAVLEQRQKMGWVPAAFFGAWALGAALGYAEFNLASMAGRNPSVWAAMLMTLVLITLLALAVTQVGAGLPIARRFGNARWSLGAACGIVALPLTNLLSQYIGQLVLPFVR